jgi:hypothetical protein
MFRLKDAEIIAAGRTRDVYRHPDDASLLIKVIRPSAIQERYGRGAPWYKFKRRRYRHLIAYLREIREQIAVHATGQPHPPFLQKIVGFVDTDLGMGLVVEAVRAPDGTSAPTVAELAGQGRLDPARLAALDRFLDEMVNSPVIVADLNPFNVVYGRGADGSDHFVLIDGIGHKNLIPLERMSAQINRWSKARKAERFRQMVAARIAAPNRPTGVNSG